MPMVPKRKRRKKANKFQLFSGVMFFILGGCTSVTLPLCPDIAFKSYGNPADANYVNYFAAENAKAMNISILPLSWFSAKFSGTIWDLNSFEKSYKDMLCAFSPAQQYNYIGQTYGSCMVNAESWMQLVASGHGETLMSDPNNYYEDCVSGLR